MDELKTKRDGMSEIVKTVCLWVESFIFLFGIYIVFFGHLTPGGGFAGGVIIAGGFILIMLSFGRERVETFLPHRRITLLESTGAILFVLGSLFGLFWGDKFFTNLIQKKFGSLEFKLLSAGQIPLYNIAIAMKVMAGIFLVFWVLSITRVVLEKNGLKMVKKK
ncbi:MAG: MnhB domain-containing protein [Elusimicrobia bacterium]|nr:MnhB domain-containing protein [Elusimicrobiota bacterium]